MPLFDSHDLNHWRELFPVTRGAVYLNHAAVSPFSTRVRQEIEAFVTERLSSAVDNVEVWLARREEIRSLAARILGAPKEGVAFVKNTSSALNNLAQGLPWKSGDRILMATGEFPSNVYPFINLKKHGVEVDVLQPKNGTFQAEDFEQAIGPRTRLLTVSFVQYHNGFRSDLEAIGEICRKKDVWFCVDSIQGCGVVPMETEHWGIDFLANGGHKWLMSPAGTAIQYVGAELLQALEVTTLSWLSVKNAWAFDTSRIDLLDDARRFEFATENFLGLYGMHAALSLLLDVGIDRVYGHVTALLDRMVTNLRDIGCTIETSLEPKHRSGIVSVTCQNEDRTRIVFEHLKSGRMIVSLRNGKLRVAPHFYNSPEEIDRFTEAIRENLRE